MCGLFLLFAGVAMAGLSGTYTVKPQGGGDFVSLHALTDTLFAVGMSGDCEFLVDSGDYSFDLFDIADLPRPDTFAATIKPAPGQHVWYNGRSWDFAWTQTRIKVIGFDFAPGVGMSIVDCGRASVTGCTFRVAYLDIERGQNDTIMGNQLSYTWLTSCRDVVIANNSFAISDSTASSWNLELNGCPGAELYFNTFYLQILGMLACCDVGYDSADVKNNIFIARGGTTEAALMVNSASGIVYNTDYNCFWPESPTAVVEDDHIGQLYSLAEWQATGQDLHGIEADPMITGPLDPHLLEGSPCIGAGVPIPGFEYDIDGDLRDPVHPDIGCDEFTGQACWMQVVRFRS